MERIEGIMHKIKKISYFLLIVSTECFEFCYTEIKTFYF